MALTILGSLTCWLTRLIDSDAERMRIGCVRPLRRRDLAAVIDW